VLTLYVLSDDVELLPKTPSSKKTRRRVNCRTSGGGDNAAPKRALRSSKRLSSQNSLDISANGKLPERYIILASEFLCMRLHSSAKM